MKIFKGGIKAGYGKEFTKGLPIEKMPPVAEYKVCLTQHVGNPCKAVVSAGDIVVEGQLIGKADGLFAPVHSPVCGEVVAVEKGKDINGNDCEYVKIKADGRSDEALLPSLANPTDRQIIERCAEAGLVGLGSAGYPTAEKMKAKVDTLVINAAECEGYLNADSRLIVERIDQVVEGIKLVAKAVLKEDGKIFVGIEELNQDAYQAFYNQSGITPVCFKAKYPLGAEKNLIYAVTGRKVPPQKLPRDVGVAVFNVQTCYAVYKAVVLGKALTERLITVSGRAMTESKILEVKVGTPFEEIIAYCGGVTENVAEVISGGPYMGTALSEAKGYVVKTTSGLVALDKSEASLVEPSPCINCGKCIEVCPMSLVPVYIDFYSNAGDYESAKRYGALNCIECGCCAYVCPAKRQIVQSVRKAKMKLKEKK